MKYWKCDLFWDAFKCYVLTGEPMLPPCVNALWLCIANVWAFVFVTLFKGYVKCLFCLKGFNKLLETKESYMHYSYGKKG